MRTSVLMVLLFVLQSANAQDSINDILFEPIKTHTQVFSLSPISKKVDKVNGLVFGVGHVANKRVTRQTINGLNIEANPAPAVGAFWAFLAIMELPNVIKANRVPDSIKNTEGYLKIQNLTTTPHLKVNGINLSTGCFFTTTSMNGLNISTGNKFNHFNGLSITALGTIAGKQYGLAIGMYNANNTLKGSTIGVFNQSYNLKGLHIGVFNKTKHNYGLQVGILNKSNSKGLQLGLWNVNNKRSMPFINW